ncbi:unnamed protein product [Kluyveromyces dobzhanskii CBS 2104]|uniref:WGS project CCBQ000000000 data, contig 00028 n=1 Tax=Kluyveromyces dobzhanskii CBS 2104 TaxID=1427455 RepID=A0A0A8KYV0_9SACH|nr:unnamed protein product [Kluyveromyces dobzhanskii CBS 2104]
MENDRKHLEHPGTRDLPRSVSGFARDLKSQVCKEITWNKTYHDESDDSDETSATSVTDGNVDGLKEPTRDHSIRKNLHIYWPIFTTGSGLFSDGYINASIGTVSTCLAQIYGDQYSNSHAIQNVSSIAFVGIVLGQLSFGYIADYYSRKLAMLLGNIILIVFSILAAGAWGVGTTSTNAGGIFAAITAYRFFLGVGIGSEYPAGSTAAAEASALLPAKKRNRWFVWFTNFMIDWGFVIAAIVPLVLICIFGEHRLQWVWRLTMGLGAIPPFSLFLMRLKFKENKSFTSSKFNKIMPYGKIFKFYWFRTIVISIIWFLYNFSSYAFGIYSSLIINNLLTNNSDETVGLKESFSWNVLFNAFYLPGSFLGAIFADYIGPRLTLCLGLFVQAMFGIGMTCGFVSLEKNIAAFTVVFGIFTSLGEFSVGDNIGLIASKSYATPVRGTLYSISAAVAKIGAFAGTYAFPQIIKNAGGSDTTNGMRAPFWVATALCLFSCALAFFFLPELDPNAIIDEDRKFNEYLAQSGYDMSTMGEQKENSEFVEYTQEVFKSDSLEKN